MVEGPPTIEELARSVVQVQLLLGDQVTCTGSGTIVVADGTIVTNSHVVVQDEVCPHDRIGVAITDVPELPPLLLFEADLLVDDPVLDIAVIRIARTLDGQPVTDDFPTVQLGDSDQLSLGDTLRVIGYPGIGGETITFTEGAISGFVTVPGIGARSWLKTDATIVGGNSGGLAVDAEGRFVGIPTIVGTGGGSLTDCRVVADSNGDGRLDQNDTCVPVGGFINGIRPVNLAVALLDAAATATPIDQGVPGVEVPVATGERARATAPVWTLELDADGFASAPVLVVPSAIPQLCFTWSYSDLPTGTPFEVVWLVDGIEQPDFGAVGTNQGDEQGAFFACISNDVDGLADGAYEVVWFADGERVFTHGTYVGGDRTQITIEVINRTGVELCVIQFSPDVAFTYGLNLIGEAVPPDFFQEIFLPSGRWNARVIDCDGAIRFEDPEGTDLLEDMTLTVE